MNVDNMKVLFQKGLMANFKLRKSMESLEKGQFDREAIGDVLRNQAEVNQINMTLNSVNSLSLIFGQKKVSALEGQVRNQSVQIAGLNQSVYVHELVIKGLVRAIIDLQKKYQSLRKAGQRNLLMLQVIQVELNLYRLQNVKSSSFSEMIGKVIRSTMRYGILALLCDAIIKMSQLLNLVELITNIALSKRSATRTKLIVHLSTLGALVLLVRRKFDVIMAILQKILFQ